MGGLEGKALEAAGGGPLWDAITTGAKNVALGDGGPPASSLRPLALHCAEQWTGRVRPECLEVTISFCFYFCFYFHFPFFVRVVSC